MTHYLLFASPIRPLERGRSEVTDVPTRSLLLPQHLASGYHTVGPQEAFAQQTNVVLNWRVYTDFTYLFRHWALAALHYSFPSQKRLLRETGQSCEPLLQPPEPAGSLPKIAPSAGWFGRGTPSPGPAVHGCSFPRWRTGHLKERRGKGCYKLNDTDDRYRLHTQRYFSCYTTH